MNSVRQSNIDVCVGCGKLYARAKVKLCTRCATSEERRFELVRSFLRENQGASVGDIALYTGIGRSEISRFYEQGRLIGYTPPGP